MAVSHIFSLQQAVVSAIETAVPGVQVTDHVPHDPPDTFFRLDGISLTSQHAKNCARGWHRFMVHHFQRPVRGATSARGNKLTLERMSLIHAPIMAIRISDHPMTFVDFTIDRDEDGVTVHGVSEFRIFISG